MKTISLLNKLSPYFYTIHIVKTYVYSMVIGMDVTPPSAEAQLRTQDDGERHG